MLLYFKYIIYNIENGEVEVEITAREVDRPLFQTKVRTPNGLRTLAPLGS